MMLIVSATTSVRTTARTRFGARTLFLSPPTTPLNPATRRPALCSPRAIGESQGTILLRACTHLLTFNSSCCVDEMKSIFLLFIRFVRDRHLQYDFELGAAFAWCAPAMFTHPLPYLYFVFLTILLVDRAHRDDHKCTLK